MPYPPQPMEARSFLFSSYPSAPPPSSAPMVPRPHHGGYAYPVLAPAHHPSSGAARYTTDGPTYPALKHGTPNVGMQQAAYPHHPSDEIHDHATPTYVGHIKTSTDAILLLAACDLPHNASALSPAARQLDMSQSTPPRRIHRRLLETERPSLIRSGSVFVWDEKDAGMRRWTDGRCWSASRVSGCFLTYRELEVRKRSSSDPNGPKSNQYKIDGLIKQSFSMTTTSGRKLHIVSYYTKRDLRENRLRRVSEDPRFVGEAGGEWGLSVDEAEYPDPALALEEQQLEQQRREQEQLASANAHRHVGRSSPHTFEHRSNTSSPRHEFISEGPPRPLSSLPRHETVADSRLSMADERTAQRPPLPRVPLSTSHAGMMPSYPAAPAMAAKRAFGDEGFVAHISIYDRDSSSWPTRPSIKRLRSNSFTPTAGAAAPATIAPSSANLGRRLSDDPISRLGSNHLLSMSNIRDNPSSKGNLVAGSRRVANDDTPDSDQTDHDGASALLSLRSSLGCNSSGRGFVFSSGQTTDTPTNLTSSYSAMGSPESTPMEPPITPSLGIKGASLKRPSLPGRAASDRDALNRLSIRF